MRKFLIAATLAVVSLTGGAAQAATGTSHSPSRHVVAAHRQPACGYDVLGGVLTITVEEQKPVYVSALVTNRKGVSTPMHGWTSYGQWSTTVPQSYGWGNVKAWAYGHRCLNPRQAYEASQG